MTPALQWRVESRGRNPEPEAIKPVIASHSRALELKVSLPELRSGNLISKLGAEHFRVVVPCAATAGRAGGRSWEAMAAAWWC